jgi:Tfp pilus assembly protein FimV
VAREAVDPGSQTLPVTSMTLADLYMQQGFKTEASAVLSQVLQEEPENVQARSKLAEVSSPPSQGPPGMGPSAVAIPSGPGGVAEARARGGATGVANPRAEALARSIVDLKAFLGAVEREATYQRATERGAF